MQATSTATSGADVATDETYDLIASDKVEGTSVYNRQGESLGSIYNVMIDKRGGQVRYAVVQFGGLLGVGSSYYPLPWRALTYDAGMNGYIVDIDKDRLKNAPSHSASAAPNWTNPSYTRGIDRYYGIWDRRVWPRHYPGPYATSPRSDSPLKDPALQIPVGCPLVISGEQTTRRGSCKYPTPTSPGDKQPRRSAILQPHGEYWRPSQPGRLGLLQRAAKRWLRKSRYSTRF